MSVGVDKPWPRDIVTRLRAAALDSTHWPAIALLSDAADALEAAEYKLGGLKVNADELADQWNDMAVRLEAAEARIALDKEIIADMQQRGRAAEARAEKAERELADMPCGPACRHKTHVGRRLIAENAAVLERLGTSGDQTVSEQAIAAEATRLAQSRNLMHKSENPGDLVVGIDAVDGVTPRTLNDVFGLNDPDEGKHE